jgi:hypothetical protein
MLPSSHPAIPVKNAIISVAERKLGSQFNNSCGVAVDGKSAGTVIKDLSVTKITLSMAPAIRKGSKNWAKFSLYNVNVSVNISLIVNSREGFLLSPNF